MRRFCNFLLAILSMCFPALTMRGHYNNWLMLQYAF